MKNLLLTLCLLSVTGSNIISLQHTNDSKESNITSKSSIETLEQCYSQTETIDRLLQVTGQAINNNKVTVVDKEAARETIVKLRNILTPILGHKELNAYQVCSINSYVLQALEFAVGTKFSKVSTDEIGNFNDNLEQTKRNLTNLSIDENLIANDKSVSYLINNMSKLSQSFTQRSLNKLEKLNKDFHVLQIGKRLLPYTGLLSYYILVTKKEELPKIFHPVKDTIGSLKRSISKTEATAKFNSHQDPKDDEKVDPVSMPTTLVQATSISVESKTRSTSIDATGWIGYFFSTFGKLVALKEETLFTFAPIAILAPIIKKDIQDLTQWGTQQSKNFYSYIKGDGNDKSPIKSAKGKFSDVVGFENVKSQLNELVNYYKNKPLLDLVGPAVKSRYLLVGPEDIAKSLVYSLGGEISSVLKERNSKESCSIYEISANKLVTTPLSDIVKEAEAKTPCIILIKNIDDLKPKTLDAKEWSTLITTLSQSANTNKEIYVYATATNFEDVYQPLVRSNVLDTVVKIDQPNFENRQQFLIKELERNFVPFNKEIINYLAQETNNSSYITLKELITVAINNSQINAEKLEKKHFTQALNKIIYKIYDNDQYSTAAIA